MLKIWGRPNSICTQRVLWACGEADVPFELELASATMGADGHVSRGGQAYGHVDTSKYRSLNPNGTIPTIDDNGYVLWDSVAIVSYVSAKYAPAKLFPLLVDDAARALQWMCWTNEHLEPLLHTLVMECVRLAPEQRSAEARVAACSAVIAKLEVLDQILAGQRYLTGDEFCMGDIPAGATVYRW
ncbi:MAG: glutathione S-transferase family protein, partial [Hyphomicrobiaceae bacterium]